MVNKGKRELISHAHKSGIPVKVMAEMYEVPVRTINGLLKHERETGSMEPKTKNCGRPSAVDAEGMEHMKRLIEEQPHITLEEIKEAMHLSIGISAISRKVKHKLVPQKD
jgi:transposase